MSYATKGLANCHPEVFGPVAHWTLGSTLASTFGSRPLTVESGTERYSDLLPGLRGFYFDGATGLIRNVNDAALQITGDMTFLCLMSVQQSAAVRVLVSHSASGETQAANTLYFLSFTAGVPTINYQAELGAGADISYSLAGLSVPLATPCQFGFTRASGQVQFYLNGTPVGAVSSALSSPDGGTSGVLHIGADVAAASPMSKGSIMASPIMFDKALNALQVKQMYNRSLGPALGLLG